eukprot:TRINITY_DN9194_c0_g1_i11.p1 TRINITY_DN9194_c0_g1~~TRINITY_DN9194_c0_g1_i11.p1  ORF type:complete len:260 (-),score=39.48 TRINITY_DN9194_c0_g1_i11:61-840(-)
MVVDALQILLCLGKCLDTIKEPGLDPQLYCMDFNQDATKFAVVGSEPILKIYDEQSKRMEYKMTGEGCVVPGHGSRVFCVKWYKDDPNIVLTGGWDYRVIVWDLRERIPVKSIYGPMICGDGIDICDDVIVTASWTQTNQLQTWDLGTTKNISTFDWEKAGPQTTTEPIFLYSSQFSKVNGSVILAGGSNSNEAKLFDRDNLDRHICTVTGLTREIDTVDFSNKGGLFAMGGGDGYVRIFAMNIIAQVKGALYLSLIHI